MKKNKTLGFILATVMLFGSVATANTGVANAASENTKSIVQEKSIPGMPENEQYTVYKSDRSKLNKIAEEVINATERLYIVEFTTGDETITAKPILKNPDKYYYGADEEKVAEIVKLIKSGTIGQLVFYAEGYSPTDPNAKHIFATIDIKEEAPEKGTKWLFQRSELYDAYPNKLNNKGKNLYNQLDAAENTDGWKVIKSTLRIEGALIERYEIHKLDENGPGSELYYTVDIMHDAITNKWEKGNDGYWYYYDNGGDAVRGFQQLTWNGVKSTYYFDREGRMQTGWKQIDGQWYYFNAGGSMKTGWLKSGNKWYYLQDNGVMVTGWNKINYNKPGFSPNIKQSYWFYFGENGDMSYGWKKIDNKWYYFDGYGAMAQNIVVDGKYFVDHNGVWDGITIK